MPHFKLLSKENMLAQSRHKTKKVMQKTSTIQLNNILIKYFKNKFKITHVEQNYQYKINRGLNPDVS